MIPSALLVDGGALREFARATGQTYHGDFVEDFAHRCINPNDERLVRIFYYDAPRYEGTVKLPVSGEDWPFTGGGGFLNDLALRDRFAVRRGSLKFRGWRPKRFHYGEGERPTDEDFEPIFEQKGVDMRIGLDIAVLAQKRSITRLILLSTDGDMAPAMKHARREGLEMGIVQLPPPERPLQPELLTHCDFVRFPD